MRVRIRFLLDIADRFSVRKPNSLLLVRLDEIGDYILFRNFIEILKSDVNYGKYKITLCGNKAWKDLAEHFDSEYVDDFFWIDKKKFRRSRVYRYFLLIRIHMRKYDILIHPTFSRTSFSEDIVREVDAGIKIACTGNSVNFREGEKEIYDRVYERLVPVTPGLMFEFYRNKEFFENLLGYKICLEKLSFDMGGLKFDRMNCIGSRYIVLFPGANSPGKKWGAKNFSSVTEHIMRNYGYDIVIAGSEEDKVSAENIIGNSPGRIHDFTGRTTLTELFILIDNSDLLITHDTSALHIAAALNKKSICISNGSYLGRFIPYPKEIYSNMTAVFPEEVDPDEDSRVLYERYRYGTALNINDIKVENVIAQIDRVLREKVSVAET